METFKIKPAEGLIIRDPETFEMLPPKGDIKPKTSYWLKHLKAGDVVLVETSAAKTATPKKDAN